MDCEKEKEKRSSQILRSLAEYMQFLCSKHLSHDISITFSGQLYLCVDKQTHKKIELVLDEELTRSDQPNIVHTSNSYSTLSENCAIVKPDLHNRSISAQGVSVVTAVNNQDKNIHIESAVNEVFRIRKENLSKRYSSKDIRNKKSAVSLFNKRKKNISKEKCPSATSTLSKAIGKEKSAPSKTKIDTFDQSISAAPELDLDFKVYTCGGSVTDVCGHDFVVNIDKPNEDCDQKSALVSTNQTIPTEAVSPTPISSELQENDHDIIGKYLFYHQFHSLWELIFSYSQVQ